MPNTPGALRDRVRVTPRTHTPTGLAGEDLEGYDDAAAVEVAAEVVALTGREAERAGQTAADQPHRVTVRAEADAVAALVPSARVVWLRPGHPLGDLPLSVSGQPAEDRRGSGPAYLVAVCTLNAAFSNP
jgi:head-tail adaptor